MAQPFKRTRTKNGKRAKDAKYTIKYRLADGSWRYETAFRDKQASQQLLADRVRAVERGEMDLVDEFKDFRGMPLGQHLMAFTASVKAGGATDKYVQKLRTRLTYAFEVMKASRAADLTMDRAEKFILHLRDVGRGLTTVNHYISALKEFSRWGYGRQRWVKDALAGLKRVNAEQDLRRPRRAVTFAEFEKLVNIEPTRALDAYVATHPKAADTMRAKLRWRGECLAMAYQLAGLAGLRFNDVKTLTWADVDLDRGPGILTIRAKNAKSKREDTVPLCGALAEALLAWYESERGRLGRAPRDDERVVHMGSRFRDSFKGDLKAAGLAETDGAGRYFDFHALRHSFATWLADKGTHPKVAQELMRHADIRMTLKFYTHTTTEQQRAPLDALPRLGKCAPKYTTNVTTDVTTESGGCGQGQSSEVNESGDQQMVPDGQTDGGWWRRWGQTQRAASQRLAALVRWWRRGESNPRPVTAHQELLRA